MDTTNPYVTASWRTKAVFHARRLKHFAHFVFVCDTGLFFSTSRLDGIRSAFRHIPGDIQSSWAISRIKAHNDTFPLPVIDFAPDVPGIQSEPMGIPVAAVGDVAPAPQGITPEGWNEAERKAAQ